MASAPLTVQQVWLKKRAVLNFVLKKENSSYFKRGNNCINLPEMLFPRRKLSYTVVASGYCRSIISVVSAHLRAPSVPCDNWSGDSEHISLYVAVYIIRTPLRYFCISINLFLQACRISRDVENLEVSHKSQLMTNSCALLPSRDFHVVFLDQIKFSPMIAQVLAVQKVNNGN